MARPRDDSGDDVRLDMTPMIDCTFNLLIFFLCNINFRALDAKIPCFLPRDAGVAKAPLERELERLDLRIARAARPDLSDPAWSWHESQLAITLQGRRVAGLEELHARLVGVRAQAPEARVVLEPGRGSLYIDSVKVLNECLRAGVRDVTFKGVPVDG